MSLHLGIELSPSQLRAVVLSASPSPTGAFTDEISEMFSTTLAFDTTFPAYGTHGGIYTGLEGTAGDAYTTPLAMWLEGLDGLLARIPAALRAEIATVGGSAPHALIWWRSAPIPAFASLDSRVSLQAHFGSASSASGLDCFSVEKIPLQGDSSSHAHSLAIEALVGGAAAMARRTGCVGSPGLAAGQMLRVREGGSGVWESTGRVQLATSFLTSLLMGRWAAVLEADAAQTGMWSHERGAWDEAVLDIVAGSREEGRKLRGWLGEVAVGARAGVVGRYMVDRFGFRADAVVALFLPDSIASYLSVPPPPGSALLSFGPLDTLMTPAATYLPSPDYILLPHPYAASTAYPYIALLPARNADVARALVRDMYTKSWSAFDRLVAIVPPGGSIGLDDKLFSFWRLVPDSYTIASPYVALQPAHPAAKGIFRFEHGVPVQEFRDLRANPRCLIESQLMAMRVRWAVLCRSGCLFPAHRAGDAPMPTAIAGAAPMPDTLTAIGAAANFPSIADLLSDLFNAPLYIPAAQLAAASVPGFAHRNDAGSVAAIGAAMAARFAEGDYSAWLGTQRFGAQPSDPAALANAEPGSAHLVPVAPLAPPLPSGLVLVAEPDADAWAAYEGVVREWVRVGGGC